MRRRSSTHKDTLRPSYASTTELHFSRASRDSMKKTYEVRGARGPRFAAVEDIDGVVTPLLPDRGARGPGVDCPTAGSCTAPPGSARVSVLRASRSWRDS